MPDSTEASSPATTGDAKPAAQAEEKKGSGNLTQGQAAARLFAAQAEAAQAPAQTATEETAPAKPAKAAKPEKTNASVAEAEAASVEADPIEPEEAELALVERTAEEETTAEPESTEEADSEVPSHSTSVFTPDQQKIFDKRVGKEMGKRQAAEAKLAAAEARLAAAEAAPKQVPAETQQQQPAHPVPSHGPQPLMQYQDLASLGNLQVQAKEAVRWAEQILDTPKAWKTKTDTDPETGEETSYKVTTVGDQTYTEQGVKGIMRQAKLTLEDHIPARAQFVTARQQASQVAHQEFPFLKDKSSPEYQQAQAMLRDPWLQMRPDAEWIVGMQIEGMKALEARKGATKTAAESKAKPKVATPKPSNDQAAVSSASTTTRVPVQTGVRAALAAEEAKLKNKGGITTAEAAASLQARERLRNSR